MRSYYTVISTQIEDPDRQLASAIRCSGIFTTSNMAKQRALQLNSYEVDDLFDLDLHPKTPTDAEILKAAGTYAVKELYTVDDVDAYRTMTEQSDEDKLLQRKIQDLTDRIRKAKEPEGGDKDDTVYTA